MARQAHAAMVSFANDMEKDDDEYDEESEEESEKAEDDVISEPSAVAPLAQMKANCVEHVTVKMLFELWLAWLRLISVYPRIIWMLS